MASYNFYPGPSRVNKNVPDYFRDAYNQGIMGINHRSDAFMELSRNCIQLLKEKLTIPSDYEIFFTSSATECWEIINQSLITKKSYHLFNGAFGEKWFNYSKLLHESTEGFAFGKNEKLSLEELIIPFESELICLTQNETSNATQISGKIIRSIRKSYPETLIAIDATSSLGGIHLPMDQADIWLASVQKCFGLPAGLGLLICSPKAIEKAHTMGEAKYYNSLTALISNMEKYQTSYTPNVLAIYLLYRVLQKRKKITAIEAKTLKRYNQWATFLSDFSDFEFLIDNEKIRSNTVIALKSTSGIIEKIHELSTDTGITFGKGYGNLKTTSFRIANFPSILKKEIEYCQYFLRNNFN